MDFREAEYDDLCCTLWYIDVRNGAGKSLNRSADNLAKLHPDLNEVLSAKPKAALQFIRYSNTKLTNRFFPTKQRFH